VGKTKQILKGKFPAEPLTLDQQVEIVNKASGHILEAFLGGDQDKVDRQVNNFALWLGGLHPDIQVYAFQVLLKGYKIGFDADDKTEARMARLEERIEASTGYIQYSYDQINHYPWPVEYLDGTTFEDRLEDLAKEVREEQDLKIVTVDTILSGVSTDKIEDISMAYAVMTAVVHALVEGKTGYDQPTNSLEYQQFHERINNSLGWLFCQEPEITIVGLRTLMSLERMVFNPKLVSNWDKLSEEIIDLIKSAP
jgi:hypothetical protein